MLRGDREAMNRLHAAGARPPKTVETSHFSEKMAGLASSVKKSVTMIMVPDVARALAWYTSIGFREIARYADDGSVNFGMVSFGEAELMLNMHGTPGVHDASLWFYTDRIDDLYQLLKSRRLEAARSQLTGQPDDNEGIVFEQDIEDMFYGARQFGIRDPNGYILYFIQPTAAGE
jgi:catechol 2,3-dioxygenase-like lactoylglutathione lyase family enzyme